MCISKISFGVRYLMTTAGNIVFSKWFYATLWSFFLIFPAAAGAQQWTFSSQIDSVEGTRIATASVSSSSGSAHVRCKNEILETYFAPRFAYIGRDSAAVRYRFSGSEVNQEDWSVSTRGSAVFAPVPVHFARELARANSLAMDIYDFSGAPNRVIIPLTGSRAAISRVLNSCGLPLVNPGFQDEGVNFRVVIELESMSLTDAKSMAKTFDIGFTATRPIELYLRLSEIYDTIGVKGCLDPKSEVYGFSYCLEWRQKRSTDPEASFQLWPLEVINAWSEAKELRDNPELARQRRAGNSGTSAVRCQEAPSSSRLLRPFNVERAYPQRARDQKQEGSVTARLQISNSGDVVGVIIETETLPGVFSSAVDREARRMVFTPARRDCENVSSEYNLEVTFSPTI